MPDITTANGPISAPPRILDYRNIGTAAGTTTLLSEPGYLASIQVTRRKASGVAIVYDSAGTSGTVIGTITLGTQTFSDPPPPFEFNVRTKNGLTVTNDADFGYTVSFGK